MDLSALWLAVRTRAVGDNGSGGNFNVASPLVSGIYPNIAPPTLTFPFIVYDVASATQRHAFAKDIYDVVLRFGIYVPFESTAYTDPHDRASKIIVRLTGNWASASPATAPTYGFHRHKLVLATGDYSAGYMAKTGAFVQHEDSHLQFIEEYSLIVQR